MTTQDLDARGFRRAARLPRPYTYCAYCDTYHWFSWYCGPVYGVTVTACDQCGTVLPAEERAAKLCPLVDQPIAVGE